METINCYWWTKKKLLIIFFRKNSAQILIWRKGIQLWDYSCKPTSCDVNKIACLSTARTHPANTWTLFVFVWNDSVNNLNKYRLAAVCTGESREYEYKFVCPTLPIEHSNRNRLHNQVTNRTYISSPVMDGIVLVFMKWNLRFIN